VRRFTIPKVTRIPSPVRASESVGIVPDAEEVWPEPCDEASRPLADQHLCGASRLIRNRAAHGARSAGGREDPGASREDSRRQSKNPAIMRHAVSYVSPRRLGAAAEGRACHEDGSGRGPPLPSSRTPQCFGVIFPAKVWVTI